MKKDIHDSTYKAIPVTCSCGHSFATRSSYAGESMQIEICSKCHPFYTGQQKLVDTAGQVDKFKRRFRNLQK